MLCHSAWVISEMCLEVLVLVFCFKMRTKLIFVRIGPTRGGVRSALLATPLNKINNWSSRGLGLKVLDSLGREIISVQKSRCVCHQMMSLEHPSAMSLFHRFSCGDRASVKCSYLITWRPSLNIKWNYSKILGPVSKSHTRYSEWYTTRTKEQEVYFFDLVTSTFL